MKVGHLVQRHDIQHALDKLDRVKVPTNVKQ